MKFAFACITIAGLVLAGSATAQESRVLKLGMQGTAGDPQHEGVMAAAKQLEETSGGRLKIEVFPNSQLGTFTEMMEQVTLGELDFTLNPFGGMDPWVARAGVASAAYVVRDFDHLQAILASDWGKGVLEEMEKNNRWHTVDSWYFGTRQTTSKKAINSVEDMKGMKLRVPNSAPLLAWAKAMGASPTPVAFAEVYLALQTNQVDGQENPLPIIDAMKFMEVQSHISLTNHLVQDQLVLMSSDTWEALSEEDQKLVSDAFKAGGDVNDKIVTEKEAALLAQFEKNGATIVKPDLAGFRAAMKPIYDELDTTFGAGTVQSLADLAK